MLWSEEDVMNRTAAKKVAMIDEPTDEQFQVIESAPEENTDVPLDLVATFMRAIGQSQLLTREQEAILGARILEGDETAVNELIEHNLRLVFSVAKRYQYKGLELLDLVQEGNIGLWRAAKRFDYRKGFKFATYALWYIRQAISRAVYNQSREIRLPVHICEGINKVRWAISKLRKANNSSRVSLEEIAVLLPKYTETQIRGFHSADKAWTVSLETKLSRNPSPHGGRDLSQEDTLAFQDGEPGAELIMMARSELARLARSHQILRDRLKTRVEELPYYIFCARYGLHNWSLEVLPFRAVAANYQLEYFEPNRINLKTWRKLGKIGYEKKTFEKELAIRRALREYLWERAAS